MNEFMPENYLSRLRHIGITRVRLISNKQFFCAHVFTSSETMAAGLLADRCRRAGCRVRSLESPDTGHWCVWVHPPCLEAFERAYAIVLPISPEGRRQAALAARGAE
jgi:hypothetical protein